MSVILQRIIKYIYYNRMVSSAYVAVAVTIFTIVAYNFLFPCNILLPLDRRTTSVVGSLACYLTRRYAFPNTDNLDILSAIDFDVLILLSSIMIVNHLIVHLKETRNVITYLQQQVQSNPIRGFWVISFTAFIVSPFLTNDGVCLLFVEPILNAFEHIDHNDNSNRIEANKSTEIVSTNSYTNKKVSNNRFGELHRADVIYYLLALACSSNLGSALTYTGNPQNMIVASDSNGVLPPYKFLIYMLPPTLFGWLITMKWIQWCWESSRRRQEQNKEVQSLESAFKGSDTPEVEIENGLMPSADTNSKPNLVGSVALFPFFTGSEKFSATGTISPLSPRRKLAREREKAYKKAAFTVTSPAPYILLILVALMIIMIFVNVMPIAGVVCIFAILMVVTVVLGNHWQNSEIWIEDENDAVAERAHKRYYHVPHHERSSSIASNASTVIRSTVTTVGGSAAKRHRRNISNQSNRSVGSEFHSEAEFSLIHSETKSKATDSVAEQVKDFDSTNRKGTDCPEGSDEHSMVLSSASQQNNNVTEQDNEQESLGPMTREDKIDNLNQFFEELFASIDYSLLIIFLGLFIVVENMASTGIPKYIWGKIVGDVPFRSVSSIMGISAFVLIASQLLGNVAVVQLAKPNVEDLDDASKRLAWAVISFVATVGGNLTITGSAANIIVAEKAARLDSAMTIDFFKHFNVCFIITLISCTVGALFITAIVKVDNLAGSNW